MAEHNPQYFIELDGNLPPEDLFNVSAIFNKNIPQFRKSKTCWLACTYFNEHQKDIYIFNHLLFETFILTQKFVVIFIHFIYIKIKTTLKSKISVWQKVLQRKVKANKQPISSRLRSTWVIREMQNKVLMKYHFIPTKMAEI